MKPTSSRLLLPLLLGLSLAACDAAPPSAPAPPVLVPEALRAHSQEFRREVITVAPGVHVAVGYGIANSVLIEAPEGLIVVDTMETLEAATEVAAEFRKISQQPVRALIYTHSHPDHIGGGPAYLLPGQAAPAVYAHARTQELIDHSSVELQTAIQRRAFFMYGNFLSPEEMVNVGNGPRLAVDIDSRISVLRPTRTFEHELEETIAGLRLRLVHAPGETEDQLFVWLPAQKVLLGPVNATGLAALPVKSTSGKARADAKAGRLC